MHVPIWRSNGVVIPSWRYLFYFLFISSFFFFVGVCVSDSDDDDHQNGINLGKHQKCGRFLLAHQQII